MVLSQQEYIDDWVYKNRRYINRRLRNGRKTVLKKYPEMHTDFTDPEKRLYCEMPLCSGILYTPIAAPTFRLPKNYWITGGNVMVAEDMRVSHWYFRTPALESYALCFTPGQFPFTLDSRLSKGEGIEMLMKKAPDLVREVEGIFFLSGLVEQIKEKLGLEYR